MHFITGASDFNYHPKQFFKNTVMWLWYVCVYIYYLFKFERDIDLQLHYLIG